MKTPIPSFTILPGLLNLKRFSTLKNLINQAFVNRFNDLKSQQSKKSFV